MGMSSASRKISIAMDMDDGQQEEGKVVSSLARGRSWVFFLSRLLSCIGLFFEEIHSFISHD